MEKIYQSIDTLRIKMATRRYKKKKTNRFTKFSRYAYKGARTVGTVASLARSVGYLRSVVNVEHKYIDINNSDAPTTTPLIRLISPLVLGSSSTARIGQSVKFTSILARFYMTINAASVLGSIIRIVIVQDKQVNGAQFVASDLFLNTGNPMGPVVLGNSKRFKILMDRVFHVDVGGPTEAVFRMYRKLDIHEEFNTGSAGTVADIQTNSLNYYAMSTETMAGTAPTINSTFRLRYIDN